MDNDLSEKGNRWNHKKVTIKSQFFMFGEHHMKWASLMEEFFMIVSTLSSLLFGIISLTKSLMN